MLKNSLFQPSLSFSFNAAPFFFFSISAFFFLSTSVPHLSSFFCFCFQRLPFASAFLFFSFGCPLFFSPKYFFFSPNVFQFFSPNVFQLFSPNIFEPKRFSAFSAQMFLLQFNHSSLFLFSALFFSGSALFFLF